MTKKKVYASVVLGFGGYWIRRSHIRRIERKFIGPYRRPGIAAYAARRRGFTLTGVEH